LLLRAVILAVPVRLRRRLVALGACRSIVLRVDGRVALCSGGSQYSLSGVLAVFHH
jgi:hypothetical protein